MVSRVIKTMDAYFLGEIFYSKTSLVLAITARLTESKKYCYQVLSREIRPEKRGNFLATCGRIAST